MKTVCKKDQCAGCSACISICPTNAIALKDEVFCFNTYIDEDKCIGCNLCTKVCPVINKKPLVEPFFCMQGWAEESIRRQSSSGGAASAIMKAFIENGGFVCTCRFMDGEFGFHITNQISEIKLFSGSKYVKSNPERCYKKINKLINSNKKVLFIGLPCQSAAVQNYCGDVDFLYTIDLICHGTPSPFLLKKYLIECGVNWSMIKDIKFRDNDIFGISSDGLKITPRRVVDSYMLTFLKGVSYTEGCYDCQFASVMRVSDVTLGDAWGGLADNNPEGVSLLLVQTQKGKELVDMAQLHLEDMDLKLAIESNMQLKAPSTRHKRRSLFAASINNNMSYRFAAFLTMPKQMIKQSIKYGLIQIGLLKDFQQTRGGV